MLLDSDIKEQLKGYFDLLEGPVTLLASLGEDVSSNELRSFITEIAHLSPLIHVAQVTLERTPSFAIVKGNAALKEGVGSGTDKAAQEARVFFAGIPMGHELTSFVMALLQVGGRRPKLEESVIERIRGLRGTLHFETYISLSCHNCPDVVQALNAMSVLNEGISHTMIDGAIYQNEVTERDIMGVPAVYLNGSFFSGGRVTLEDLLEKLGSIEDPTALEGTEPFEVLVIGGGPAGASAAVYAARKGIRTGLLAERFGGQVLDTVGVENLIGTPYTEGAKIAGDLLNHVKTYPIELIQKQQVQGLAPVGSDGYVPVTLANGVVLKSRSVIVATGARWRQLGVPGEAELKNRGVAYCPHCDGPLFKGKRVAVVGGGNSGVEAAIDLAGIVSHVTVLEFASELKADQVLQKRLRSLPNVTVVTNAQTTAIEGTEKVTGINYTDRETGATHHVALEGVFVQIGLLPNTEWLEGTVARNRMGEIVVDAKGATSLAGVFAAGDCADTAYKQIVIAIGSGATAALGAFDYLMRL